MKVFCTYCGAANSGDRPVCGACATPLEAPRPTPPMPTAQVGSVGYNGQGLSAPPSSHDPYAGVRQPGPLYPEPGLRSLPYEDPGFLYAPQYAPLEPYGQTPGPAAPYNSQYPPPQQYGQPYAAQQPSGPYALGPQPYTQDPYTGSPYPDQGYGFPAPGYPQAPVGYAGFPVAAAQPAYPPTYPQPVYPLSAYTQPAYPPAYPPPTYPSPAYPQPYPPAPGYQQGSSGYPLALNGGPGTLASTLPRFGSYLFDLIMFSIIFLVLGTIVGGLNLGVLGGLLLLAAHPLYCIGFWATTGQTPGYKAAGLQLVKSDGTKVGLGAAIIRYIGLSITVPLFLLGCLWMIWDYRKQALYDKMADTLVIRA